MSAVRSAATRNTREEIQTAIDSGDPQQMAHILYDDRADLRNTNPGDGWAFPGRGYFQYTGRYNYEHFGEKFGVDLKNQPDLAAEPEMAAKLAIAYWKDRVPEADRADAYAAGVAINGGENGADARIDRSAQWATLITPELVRGIQDGSISQAQLSTIGNVPRRAERHGHAETLRLGDTGERVALLQTQLAAMGYTDAHGRRLVSDQSFGPATDAALRAFQREHHLPTDGVVGPRTLAALGQAEPDARRIDQPSHAGYGMYSQALAGVHGLDAQQGRTPDQLSANLAGALAAESRAAGMTRIDYLALSDDATRAYAVQGAVNSPFKLYTSVDVAESVVQPLEQSSQAWTQAHHAQEQAASQQQTQTLEASQQLRAAPVQMVH